MVQILFDYTGWREVLQLYMMRQGFCPHMYASGQVPRQIPSSLQPEGAPFTSVAPLCTDTILVPIMPEAFVAVRDLLILSVLELPAVQKSMLSVPVDIREPAGSLQCFVSCQPHFLLMAWPLVPSKGKPASLQALALVAGTIWVCAFMVSGRRVCLPLI